MELDGRVELYDQRPNSPDLNINDLGFFRALEAVYMEEAPKNFEDIIECVVKAFWKYPANKLNRMWLTRMQVMNKIIECHGDNDYSLPHMNKEKLEREGRLPEHLEVTGEARRYL